ncbi:OpgC family protein [Salinarimonas ramus]|uniref:Membrane protein n=1 Tax=Salinarimonas ramus TaxID=690164 RepID=A0A917QDE2_9HYPH|nr:OpgC domain-containing protein [Salinarimonas ramus]GGK45947.1 membrane protein [Salinarimonas ramus]
MSRRNDTIDFWRGLVLVTITINHIPGNGLEHLTHRNIGFSDAAEAFVFVSGLALAVIYGPRIAREGIGPTAQRSLARAIELYRTHLSLTAFAIVSFAALALLTGTEELLTAHGRAPVFESTPEALVGLVALSYQIGYFNILPLYVALMLMAPALFLVARRFGTGWMLGLSLAVYVAGRMLPLDLPSWPEGAGGWFFDPLTWQLLFALGLAAGLTWRGEAPARVPALVGAAAAIVAVAWIVITEAFGAMPGLRGLVMPHLDLGKNELGLGRIVHFAALAYLLVALRVADVVGHGTVGAELKRLGRHGLPVFVAGSVLAALGQALTIVAVEHRLDGVAVIAMLYTLASIGFLVLLARHREWSSPVSSAPAPPKAAPRAAPLVPAPVPVPSRSSRSRRP